MPALVAQLDRASDYGSEGWGFESLQARNVSPGHNAASSSQDSDDHYGENICENMRPTIGNPTMLQRPAA